jgi:hypothetical protein
MACPAALTSLGRAAGVTGVRQRSGVLTDASSPVLASSCTALSDPSSAWWSMIAGTASIIHGHTHNGILSTRTSTLSTSTCSRDSLRAPGSTASQRHSGQLGG